jgi:hypothetical protein
VYFGTMASLHFWNLRKKTDFLIPNMTYFERKKFHPPLQASISWSQIFEWTSAREETISNPSCFIKYVSFWCQMLILIRFFISYQLTVVTAHPIACQRRMQNFPTRGLHERLQQFHVWTQPIYSKLYKEDNMLTLDIRSLWLQSMQMGANRTG